MSEKRIMDWRKKAAKLFDEAEQRFAQNDEHGDQQAIQNLDEAMLCMFKGYLRECSVPHDARASFPTLSRRLGRCAGAVLLQERLTPRMALAFPAGLATFASRTIHGYDGSRPLMWSCSAALEGGRGCLVCKNLKTRGLHPDRFIGAKSFVFTLIGRLKDLTPLF
jgi:hypothetical protein